MGSITNKMGMIDQQFKNQKLKDTLKENEELKKKIQQLEKIIELNMKDFWAVVDQRDWYYSEIQKIKSK